MTCGKSQYIVFDIKGPARLPAVACRDARMPTGWSSDATLKARTARSSLYVSLTRNHSRACNLCRLGEKDDGYGFRPRTLNSALGNETYFSFAVERHCARIRYGTLVAIGHKVRALGIDTACFERRQYSFRPRS